MGKIFPELANLARMSSYKILLHRGELVTEQVLKPGLMLVLSGFVKLVMLSHRGQKLTVDILTEGDILGEWTLTQTQGFPVYAVALTDCELSVLNHVVRGDPKLIKTINAELIDIAELRSQHLITVLDTLAFKTVVSGLAGTLLRLAKTSGGPFIELPLNQENIGYLIGTSRSNITSTLQMLKNRGLITYGHHWLKLLDQKTLVCLATQFKNRCQQSGGQLEQSLASGSRVFEQRLEAGAPAVRAGGFYVVHYGVVGLYAKLRNGYLLGLGVRCEGGRFGWKGDSAGHLYVKALGCPASVGGLPLNPKTASTESLRQSIQAALRQTDTIGRWLAGHVLESAETRIARLLIELVGRSATPIEGGLEIGLKITHNLIAEFVGAARESVTLALNQLKHQRIIDSRRYRIVITDLPRLKEVAHWNE